MGEFFLQTILPLLTTLALWALMYVTLAMLLLEMLGLFAVEMDPVLMESGVEHPQLVKVRVFNLKQNETL